LRERLTHVKAMFCTKATTKRMTRLMTRLMLDAPVE
jgi:hypothetical protein